MTKRKPKIPKPEVKDRRLDPFTAKMLEDIKAKVRAYQGLDEPAKKEKQ
jgi:hypothetical protein